VHGCECDNGCLCLAWSKTSARAINSHIPTECHGTVICDNTHFNLSRLNYCSTINSQSCSIKVTKHTPSPLYTARSRPPSCQVCWVYSMSYIRAYTPYRTSMHSVHMPLRNDSMYGIGLLLVDCQLCQPCTCIVCIHICCTRSILYIHYTYCMLRMAFLFRDDMMRSQRNPK
jgi:hypothetical protein